MRPFTFPICRNYGLIRNLRHTILVAVGDTGHLHQADRITSQGRRITADRHRVGGALTNREGSSGNRPEDVQAVHVELTNDRYVEALSESDLDPVRVTSEQAATYLDDPPF